MIYFYHAEGELAEACMHFTTRGLTAGVFRESFQALPDFMRLYRKFSVCDNHVRPSHIHVIVTHVKIICTAA